MAYLHYATNKPKRYKWAESGTLYYSDGLRHVVPIRAPDQIRLQARDYAVRVAIWFSHRVHAPDPFADELARNVCELVRVRTGAADLALVERTDHVRVIGLELEVSTLVIAALFNPLRHRIQSFIDRRFYGRKYDARKTLEAFSAKLRDDTDLDTLSDELVGGALES